MIVFDVYDGPVFLESPLGFGVSSGESRDNVKTSYPKVNSKLKSNSRIAVPFPLLCTANPHSKSLHN